MQASQTPSYFSNSFWQYFSLHLPLLNMEGKGEPCMYNVLRCFLMFSEAFEVNMTDAVG